VSNGALVHASFREAIDSFGLPGAVTGGGRNFRCRQETRARLAAGLHGQGNAGVLREELP